MCKVKYTQVLTDGRDGGPVEQFNARIHLLTDHDRPPIVEESIRFPDAARRRHAAFDWLSLLITLCVAAVPALAVATPVVIVVAVGDIPNDLLDAANQIAAGACIFAFSSDVAPSVESGSVLKQLAVVGGILAAGAAFAAVEAGASAHTSATTQLVPFAATFAVDGLMVGLLGSNSKSLVKRLLFAAILSLDNVTEGLASGVILRDTPLGAWWAAILFTITVASSAIGWLIASSIAYFDDNDLAYTALSSLRSFLLAASSVAIIDGAFELIGLEPSLVVYGGLAAAWGLSFIDEEPFKGVLASWLAVPKATTSA